MSIFCIENSICARNWPGIGIMRQIQYSLTASRYLNGKHFDPSTFQHLVVNHYPSKGFLSLKKQTEKMGQIYASRFNAFTILRFYDFTLAGSVCIFRIHSYRRICIHSFAKQINWEFLCYTPTNILCIMNGLWSIITFTYKYEKVVTFPLSNIILSQIHISCQLLFHRPWLSHP